MNKKLQRWIEAGLPSEEADIVEYGVTKKMLRQLQERTMRAIANKLQEVPGKIIKTEHGTLQ